MLDVAGVHQAEPLWEVLLQLPLSMFAPAPMLPAWGAMLQVALAFGISECWLGWRRMVMIAVLTSAITSMAARVMVFVQTTSRSARPRSTTGSWTPGRRWPWWRCWSTSRCGCGRTGSWR